MVTGWRGPSSARRDGTRPAAICFTASPRSQQELRLKPTTSGTQNQREQLARVQIVVLIVPLETVAVKSALLGRLIFDRGRNLLQTKEFLGTLSGWLLPGYGAGSASLGLAAPRTTIKVVTTPSPQSGPELLTVGSGEAGRLSRRAKVVLITVTLALLAGLMIWRFWPQQAPLFSLSSLQGVYAGMVRSDGTNDASVIDRRWTSEQDGYIVPSACEPLFEATVLNRIPQQALDGVGTFWELNRSAVSLFTYRFADMAAADREFTRLATVLDNCEDARVEVHARPASRGLLTRTQVATDSDPLQLGYVLTTNSDIKLAVHVLAFSNTVSWQFRYEPVPGTYAPLTAQRLMDSLADQMRAVQDLQR
jgi:hypothetical protein